MKKLKRYKEREYTDDSEKEINMLDVLCYDRMFGFMYYRKINDNKYEIFCAACNTYRMVDKKEFRQIKKSGICPHCFNDVDIHEYQGYVLEFMDSFIVRCGVEQYLYGARWSWKFGQLLNNDEIRGHIEQIGFSGKIPTGTSDPYRWKTYYYVKNCRLSNDFGYNYSICILSGKDKDNRWRLTKSDKYFNCYEEESLRLEACNNLIKANQYDYSKKKYLEKNSSFLTKSNQIYLAKNNLFNSSQLKAIKMFNLTDAKVLVRSGPYITRNMKYILPDNLHEDLNFNKYDLDYCIHQKIDIIEFIDFVEMCKKLGRKKYHPKSFSEEFDSVMLHVKVMENIELQEQMIEVARGLNKYSYTKENMEIRPIQSFLDIEHVSLKLHFCMAKNYSVPYATGKTELYCLRKDGEPKVGIEVRDGRLIQQRTCWNGSPSPSYRAFIKEWLYTVRNNKERSNYELSGELR